MTISSQPAPQTYACAGTTGPYAFPFRFLQASDLAVTRIDAAGARAPLTLGADYAVSGAGDDAGGAVTTTVAYADGQVEVWLHVAITQETAYTPGDAFPAQSHEDALDKLTLIAAQIDAHLGELDAREAADFASVSDAAIAVVDAEGAAQAALLEAAGAAQVAAVAAEGVASVNAVTTAGATQVSAVATQATSSLAAVAAQEATSKANVAATPGAWEYASTADALSNGVAGHASLVGGGGGTNGTFDIAFSGGGGSGAAGRFVVAGGALVAIVITAKGRGYTSAPTMSFAASSGLTGASATAVIAQNQAAGTYFTVPVAGGFELFKVDTGGTTATSQSVYPSLANINARLNLLPGPNDIHIENNGAILQISAGAAITVTPTEIVHPKIVSLTAGVPSARPGPDSISFFSGGALVASVRQADQAAIPGLVASAAALSGLQALATNGGLLATPDMVVIGDSKCTVSQGFINELAARYASSQIAQLGISGQTTAGCSARFGADCSIVVTGNSIPAFGASATIVSIAPNPFEANAPATASHIAVCDGVPVIISQSGGVKSITRQSPGGVRTIPNPAILTVRSTQGTNTDASGTTLLSTLRGRTLIAADGHNDIMLQILRGGGGYSRQTILDRWQAEYDRCGSVYKHVHRIGITRGIGWLTQVRIDAIMGGGSGIVSQNTVGTDAATIGACDEADALIQIALDRWPGTVDAMAAAISAGITLDVDFGSGIVRPFITATYFPDGIHGTTTVGGAYKSLVDRLQSVRTALAWAPN